ncbi:MAG: lysophospholipid acyltransferase family protein [Bacillota bacterium]
MLKTIWWFTYFWLYQFYSIIHWIKLKFLKLTGQDRKAQEYINTIAQKWGKRLVEQTGSEIEVKGEQNLPKEPCLLVSNHQGAFDIPLLLGYVELPLAFIAKWELRYFPLVSTWMKELQCIFIKRDNLRQTLRAYKNAGKVFETGQSLVVFPEGTRSKSSQLGEFKRGSLKIALREEVPIVPIAIDGSYKMREANNGVIQGAKVKITINQPLYPEDLSSAEEKELVDNIRRMIEGLVTSNQ